MINGKLIPKARSSDGGQSKIKKRNIHVIFSIEGANGLNLSVLILREARVLV